MGGSCPLPEVASRRCKLPVSFGPVAGSAEGSGAPEPYGLVLSVAGDPADRPQAQVGLGL